MKQIDIQQLERNGWTEYADENLAFIDDTKNLSALLDRNDVKTDFVLCVICLDGRLQVTVDNEAQSVYKRQAMVCPINTVITNFMCSPDFRAFAICASPSIFKDLYLNKQMWEYYQYVLTNHVVEFSEADWNRFICYYKLMNENLADTGKKFRQHIIRSLWQGFIYEFICVIDRHVKHTQPSDEKTISSEALSSRFMEMLATSEGRTHTVAEFAARLFVTPKYLSMSVKQTTGKSALKWIHESMTKEIERQLTHSDWSIKEIANKLNFPNPSFFGKFVKTHLGDTPANIRNRELTVSKTL